MIRLHITGEGQTELAFVKHVLAPYLAEYEVYADARAVLTSKDKRTGKTYRGGFRRTFPYETARRDILSWISEDRNPDAFFTTMFDLYALPDDFPGCEMSQRMPDPYAKVSCIETAFGGDILKQRDDPRFLAYIQLHEFEALILANPQCLDREYLENEAAIARLSRMVEREGGNPELINCGATTAPSKRILAEIPEYDKVSAGSVVTGEIGMSKLLERCRHFAGWVASLKALTPIGC